MTLPIDGLHPINSRDKDLMLEFQKYGEMVDELVNFGTHILSWDVDNSKGSDEHIPIFLIFRNILENLDAISILIKHSSVEPCKNLLRVVFESSLNLEYLLDVDTHRRALAFLVCNYHKELSFIEKITDGSEANKQMSQKMKSDKIMPSGLPLTSLPGIDAQSKLIIEMLKLPLYQEAEIEYQRVVASGKKKPAWYQLFEGPANLEQLATKLNRQGMYEVFYRVWSGSIHGHSVIKGNLTTGADAGIVQIRNPKDIQQVTLHAHNLTIILYQLFIAKRLPQEKHKLKSWYMSIRRNLEELRIFNK